MDSIIDMDWKPTLSDIKTHMLITGAGGRKVDLAIAEAVLPYDWVTQHSDIQSTPECWLESRHAFTSSVDAAILLAKQLVVDWRIVMRRAWLDAKGPEDLARAHVLATLSEVLRK